MASERIFVTQTEIESATVERSSGEQSDGVQAGGNDAGSEGTRERSAALPRDLVFDLLSVTRRRMLLRYLDENEGTAPLGELSREIAAEENDVPVAQVSSKQRKRVYVGLYQSHVPKMEDAGVVDYDNQSGAVELGPNATELFPYLYFEDEPDDETTGSESAGRLSGLVGSLKERF